MRIAWLTGAIFLLSSLGTGLPGTAAATFPNSSEQAAQNPAPNPTPGPGPAPSGSTSSLPAQNGPSSPADPFAPDIEALRRLEANYLRAEMEDSAQLAGTILADDFVGLRGDGTTSGRSDVLNNLARHDRAREPYSVTATNMREYVFGDMACVTYTKVYVLAKNRASYSENLLHVFTKRNGAWRLQVSSPVPAPRPPTAATP